MFNAFSRSIARVVIVLALMFSVFFISPILVDAAVTIDGPPIDGMEMGPPNQPGTVTVGPGAIIPLARFMLSQPSGSDTLTAIGFTLNASSTLTQGNISRVSLWRESGSQMGFQIDKDTFISGAASTTPLGDTLIVLTPTTPVSITSQNSEFYLIATTSATANVVNGDAFHVSMTGDWATTTAGGLGSADPMYQFTSLKKIILSQTAPLKISEVRLGSTGNADDEFIELYNTAPYAVSLRDLGLGLHIFDANGGAQNKALTYYKTVIPERGFFLIGSQTNYSGATSLDASYATLSGNKLISNGGFSIATSTVVANATSTKIDLIAWGTQPAANAEDTALADLTVGSSFERKATTTADATSMGSGGSFQFKGNGSDTNVNSDDFVIQTTPNPQNSMSPSEFPFSGGEQSGSPRVMGSYPGPNSTGIPIDMSYIGFGFSGMVSTSTIISAGATTTVTLIAQGGSTNLCTSVSYNPTITNGPPARCNLSAQLSPSTTYTFTVNTTVYDFSGNALDQDSFTAGNQAYTSTFTTGGSSQTMTNTIPPHVIGTYPMPGSFGVPTNIAKIFVKFDQAMNTNTLNSSNITLSGGVTLSGFSFDTTSNTLSAVPSSLSANTNYTLTVSNAVQASSTGMTLGGPNYTAPFTTGTGTDSSAPTVLGTMPIVNGATGVSLNNTTLIFMFDDNIDMSTATSGSVTLSTGGVNVPGTVSYDPFKKEGSFTANNLLPANSTMTLTLVGASIKNVSGVALGSNYTMSFATEAANSDSVAPSIMFANADEFGIAITFNEPVKSTDATNIENYTLTVNSAAFSLSSMAGHNVTYDPQSRTARINGAHFTPNVSFTVTTSNIYDISGNQMTSSSFTGTVQSAAQSGGFLGPGDMQGDFGPKMGEGFTSGTMGGFMPPVNIRPFSTFKSATTTYGFEIPISQQIPANGTIVITFPNSADFGIAMAATTSSNYLGGANKDINGPGPNTIGIKTVAVDTTAKTVTLTIDTATRSEAMGGTTDTHDFLRFDLLNIKNPSIPKGPDTTGYQLDIKTKSNGTLLETLTPGALYVSGGGFGGVATTTLRGRVLGSNGNYGLNGVRVKLDSPVTGPMDFTTQTNAYGGATGEFQFTDLPINNDYMFFTEPLVSPTSTTTGYFGTSMPTPVRATSTDIHLRNITLTSTSTASSFVIKLTADASTFLAGEKIDVFAGGPGQFTAQTVTMTAGAYDNTTIANLSLPQQNGMWGIGIGPAMPKDGMFMGPPPAVTWQMPKNVEAQMSGCPSACALTINGVTVSNYTFNVSTANKTITGILKDGSDGAISNAEVFAYSPQGGFGTHAQTSSGGTFTLRVGVGTYNVGAFMQGMGQSKEIPVEVTASAVYVDGSKIASTGSSGANPFTLKMVKPSYTITGRVSDGTNAIPNAPVFAYRTDGPGGSGGMTDSSGNYTIYVDNGSWRVGGHMPGYGPLTEQAVTISGASQTNINFSPAGGTTYYSITGTVFESADATIDTGEGIENVMVNARNTSTGQFYNAKTGTDGTYVLRVPGSATYALEAFRPDYGRIAPFNENLATIAPFAVSGNTAKNIRLGARQTITINVKDTSGNFMNIPEAFIDLFDMTKGFGNHAEIRNASSTTVQIAKMGSVSSTTVRAFLPSIPPNSITVESDNGSTLVLGGVLQIDGNETIKIVINTNLRTVSGTVYHTAATAGNELKDAWVEIIDTANGMHFGTQATSTTGAYTMKIADGSYKIMAIKPGYTMAPQSLTVDGDETQNLVLTSASLTISGTVTAGGSAADGAFVRAEKVGGGFAVTKTNTDGTYTLSVDSGKWRVFASSERYAPSGYSSNPVDVSSSVTGINIALSTAASVSTQVAMSPSFTDTSSGSLHDDTVNVDVTVDSGALGQTGSSAYISAQETANFTETPGVDVIGETAKEITAYSGSSQVKNLSSGKKAEITLTYTKTELVTAGMELPSEVANLKVAAWSEDAKQWESLSTVATYKDSNGNAVEVATSSASIPAGVSTVEFKTVDATHFSPYALINPSDPSAPDTPTGLTATVDSKSQITVSWTANSEGDLSGYYLYRDTTSGGTFPLLTSISVGTNSYADTGLTANTTYYYKIAAYDTTGYESSASSEVNGTTNREAAGGAAPGSVGGGGGSSNVPTPVLMTITGTTTTILSTTTPVATAVTAVVQPILTTTPEALPATASISAIFNRSLRFGAEGEDVKRLQQLLATDADIYPNGIATGYYGAMTRNAIRKFQKKYGVASEGNSGYGLVGPATRAKLQEVFGGQEVSTPKPSLPQTASISAVFNRALRLGITGEDVTRLQKLLATDSSIYPEGLATGYYGAMTRNAVRKFQKKYGIADEGDSGYGLVGPATRAKLQEVFEGQGQAALTPSASAQQKPSGADNIESMQSQLTELLDLVKVLQDRLAEMQSN